MGASDPPKESVLRDYLASHLELIGPALELIEVEYGIPNPEGAKGSIDILAVDRATNDLVVIELKRADGTSRQALHELDKYISLLAKERGYQLARMRCIVVSTTWHELRVPFARFKKDASFFAEGLLLILDEHGTPIDTEDVYLPEVVDGVGTCPKHFAVMFAAVDSRDAALAPLASALQEKDVTDFFVLTIDFVGPGEHVIFPFGHYVVFGEFDDDLRASVRSRHFESTEEEFEFGQFEEEEHVWFEISSDVPHDSMEIGSPDRLKADAGWDISAATGFGVYEDDVLWTPEALTRLAHADGDKYSVQFDRRVKVANKPAWARMMEDIQWSLTGAAPWPALVDALLVELSSRPACEIDAHVYCPLDLVETLYEVVTANGVPGYMPRLEVAVRAEGYDRLFVGALIWDGMTFPASVDEIFDSMFGGLMGYFVARTSKGLWAFDVELCARHGLTYHLFEMTPDPDNQMFHLSVEDGTLKREQVDDDDARFRPLHEFVEANESYLRELSAKVDKLVFRPLKR